jgi:hypothetical protein
LRYSKILSTVIKAAKKLYNNNKVSQSHNKIKATWNVIKSETGGSNNKEDKINIKNNCGDHSLRINDENFNNQFLKIAESISGKTMGKNSLNINSTTYSPFKLSQILNLQCGNIGFHNTSTGEIEKKKKL